MPIAIQSLLLGQVRAVQPSLAKPEISGASRAYPDSRVSQGRTFTDQRPNLHAKLKHSSLGSQEPRHCHTRMSRANEGKNWQAYTFAHTHTCHIDVYVYIYIHTHTYASGVSLGNAQLQTKQRAEEEEERER